RWFQLPLSSARIPRSSLFSSGFQQQLLRYQQLRALKHLPVGRPVPHPPPGLLEPWPPVSSSGPQGPTAWRRLRGAGAGRGESLGCRQGFPCPCRNPQSPPLCPSSGDDELSPPWARDQSPRPEDLQHAGANPEHVPWASRKIPWGIPVPTWSLPKRCHHSLAQVGSPQPDPLASSLGSLLWDKSPCESSEEHALLSQEQRYPGSAGCQRALCGACSLPDAALWSLRDFLAHFSLNSRSIPTVHPGEPIFCARPVPAPSLDARGLQPQSPLEKLFLCNSPTRQTAFVRSGALSLLYGRVARCPLPVLRWLFQLMVLGPAATDAARALWDIWLSTEQPWCPTVLEISKAFALLGADLSPLHRLLSPKKCPVGRSTLDASCLARAASPDAPSTLVLVSQLANVCKFLVLCVVTQPCHYTDCARVVLVNVVSLLSLDRALRRQPLPELQHLLCCLLEGIRDWQEQGAPVPPEPPCHGLAAAAASDRCAASRGARRAAGAGPASGTGTAGRPVPGTQRAPTGAGRCQPGGLLPQPQPPPP
ncbi:F178B protein, partial [Rhinopomastus cyanomelas]|nr:F178B protein [Rhinopomastus cyanomelas]